jgi:CHAT domain-containing protein
MSNPITLFYSYAKQDEGLRSLLETHLKGLERSGRILPWHRREVLAGGEVAAAIDQHLNAAQIILLLISSDFMATEYCYGEEMKRALERHKRGEARVIPILLRPVLIDDDAPFAQLAMLPMNGVPVTAWKDSDEAFADIAKDLKRVLQDLSLVSPTSLHKEPEVAPSEKEELVELVTPTKPVSAQEDVLVELVETVETTIFTIKMEPGYKVSFTGEKSASEEAKDLNIYIGDLNEMTQEMRDRVTRYHNQSESDERTKNLTSWRRRIRQEGKNFYRDFIQEYSEMRNALEKAQQTIKPENLTLAFEGPRADLGMPYELLCNGDIPLVFRNPLCRIVSDAPRAPQSFDASMGRLQKRRSPLKILLIGAGKQDTASDQEVTYLYGRITQQAQNVGIRPKIDVIRPDKTTYDRVTQQLKSNLYHLVHFVGQGIFNENAGNDASLTLKRNDLNEEQVILTMAELVNLLNKRDMLLFYLGNCVGVWTDSEANTHNSTYLGAMDAIVHAGVPYVLGFRWHVMEERGRLFATYFYDHLLLPPFVPEHAVWYARKKIGETDETWTSPVLVSQYPYGLDGKM